MSLPVRHLLSLLLLLGVASASAQTPLQPDRIPAHADLRPTTRLAGHLPAWATADTATTEVPADTPLHLTFVLARSAERQAAFTQLLVDQQNPGSPSYHRWLTPQQLGALYGPTANDLAALTAWLTAQGLPVTEVSPSRIFLSVDAPASTVANALATTLRYAHLPGDATPRLAATADPAIPAAFAPLVASISGLADTPLAPDTRIRLAHPDATTSNGVHYIVPGDFAVLYDLNPVFQSGINGAGQKIAILGVSRVLPADISNFENITGLAVKQPSTIVPPTATDPGMTADDNQAEATVDVDRVFGTAPGAQADLVVASVASGGIKLAAMYAVQTLRDPILNISFSSCEATDAPANTGVNGFWNTLFAQAAAQGIAVFVSSGDSAAAGCQTAGTAPAAVQVRSVSNICASAYVTCVGGTQFADTASPATYWAATNGANLVSALSYIPEGAWNEPTGTGTTPFVVVGTGGGPSAFIPKPAWQTGTGVPADGFRDTPDISFSASAHNGYLICLTYLNANCSATSALSVSGTSVTAPAMAAIAALVNQKTAAIQGHLAPLLYRLAASSPAVFHDATPATSGVASCNVGTASTCNNSTPSAASLSGGLAGYPLAVGYDLATGLGSLDVANLLTAVVASETLTLSPAASTLILRAGATTGNTDLLTLSSQIFAGSVSLGCTVAFNGPGTAASTPICSLSPATVTLPANGSVTSTLTLATTQAAQSALTTPRTAQPALTARHTPASRIGLALGSVLLLTLLPGRRSRPRRPLLTLILLAGGLGTLSACSGSSTPIGPNPLLISATGTTATVAAPIIFAGGTATITATVQNTGFNTAVTPTGTVTFYLGGTSTPAATATLTGAIATATIPFAATGAYTLYAAYGGDNNFSASSSTGSTISVIPVGTTPGAYTVTVKATAATGLTATTTVALTVQ